MVGINEEGGAMDQPTTLGPHVPKQVAEVLEQVRYLNSGNEAVFREVNRHHWEISYIVSAEAFGAIAGMEKMEALGDKRVTIGIMRTSGGRITKPKARVDGMPGEFDWHNIMEKLGKLDVPPMLPERPADHAPVQVRKRYAEYSTALAGHASLTVSLGSDGRQWVIGIDSQPCECTTQCAHRVALRIYFQRKGGNWKANNEKFFAMVQGTNRSDGWRNSQATLVRLLTNKLAELQDETPPPSSGSVSSQPATVSNAVQVRKTTVIRN